jgi:hypothetical protein
MWDDFWRVVIFVALIAALTTCVSCTNGKKDVSSMLKSMSKNCKYGPEDQNVDFQDGETIPGSAHVACMKGYGI